MSRSGGVKKLTCLKRLKTYPSSLTLHLSCIVLVFVIIFFFQAEDGIRDTSVTGVQTCALPIWSRATGTAARTAAEISARRRIHRAPGRTSARIAPHLPQAPPGRGWRSRQESPRSEERRVGKECRARGWLDQW